MLNKTLLLFHNAEKILITETDKSPIDTDEIKEISISNNDDFLKAVYINLLIPLFMIFPGQ